MPLCKWHLLCIPFNTEEHILVWVCVVMLEMMMMIRTCSNSIEIVCAMYEYTSCDFCLNLRMHRVKNMYLYSHMFVWCRFHPPKKKWNRMQHRHRMIQPLYRWIHQGSIFRCSAAPWLLASEFPRNHEPCNAFNKIKMSSIYIWNHDAPNKKPHIHVTRTSYPKKKMVWKENAGDYFHFSMDARNVYYVFAHFSPRLVGWIQKWNRRERKKQN